MEEFVAVLFIIFGLWTFLSPKSAFKFKTNLVKNWGVSMSASPKAFKTMKYIGLIIAVVGFLMYFG